MKVPRTELYSHSDHNSALVDIAIKGTTIFAALTELTQTLETTPFDVLTHSVYRVDKEIAVPRNDKSKLQPSNVYTTHDTPVLSGDIFRYFAKIHHVSFVVLRNDAVESLSSRSAGSSIPRSVGLRESLIKTSISTIVTNIKKTLSTVAKGTYSGPLPPFIKSCLGCYSSSPEKASELLAQILLIEQFITKFSENHCNFENCSTLAGTTVLVEEMMTSCTLEDWNSFRTTVCVTSPPVAYINNFTSVSPQPTIIEQQSLQQAPTDTLWSFLEGSDCHASLENGSCVDLKTFSVTSIRKVVLVLQVAYKDIPVNTCCRVERFSSAPGNTNDGKCLIGEFADDLLQLIGPQLPLQPQSTRWSGSIVKLSHKNFVIVDQESPPEQP